MPRSSPTSSGRTLPALTALAGLFVTLVSGCAQKTTTNPAEPQLGPETESGTNSQEVYKRPHESVASLLEGRTSGVSVSTNSQGDLVVRIRGAASFHSGNQPLYVIDGIPVEPGPGGALTGMNPEDIESIEVLKGPPETTLYGVRGANGVILIKTKQAKRPDR
jgi:TonB-dependent SusC/RagA subfamily outer membrane receptor